MTMPTPQFDSESNAPSASGSCNDGSMELNDGAAAAVDEEARSSPAAIPFSEGFGPDDPSAAAADVAVVVADDFDVALDGS